MDTLALGKEHLRGAFLKVKLKLKLFFSSSQALRVVYDSKIISTL